MKINFLYSLLALIAFTGCRDVINVDLNTVEKKIIITGKVSNDPTEPQTVKITRSINVSESSTVTPLVTNATVTISDNAGNTKSLTQTVANSGVYQTTALLGVVGRTYTLKVAIDGKTYTSVSTMPAMVKFDTLVAVNGALFGRAATEYFALPIYNDPAGIKNYYRFNQIVNGKLIPTYIDNDDFTDGKTSFQPLAGRGTTILKKDDVLTVEMQSIDKGVYDYFNTLDEASSGQSVPANPETNIVGGAFGYFSAHTVQRKTVVVR